MSNAAWRRGGRVHESHTFPKNERLQYGYQFRQVCGQGRRAAGSLATVWVLDQPAPFDRAIGIVTSRRVGNAVTRNRARRLLREAYRHNKQKLKKNIQIVVVARAAIDGKTLAEIETDFLWTLQSLGALAES